MEDIFFKWETIELHVNCFFQELSYVVFQENNKKKHTHTHTPQFSGGKYPKKYPDFDNKIW